MRTMASTLVELTLLRRSYKAFHHYAGALLSLSREVPMPLGTRRFVSFSTATVVSVFSTLLVLLSTLTIVAPPALGQEMRVVGELRSSGPVTSEASKKIASQLRALMADFKAEGFTRGNTTAASHRFTSEMLKVDPGGRVQGYVSVIDTSEATLAILRQYDLEIEIVNDDFRIVQGWIPVRQLEALADEPAVTQIRPPSYGSRNAGTVVSQGDSIHRC